VLILLSVLTHSHNFLPHRKLLWVVNQSTGHSTAGRIQQMCRQVFVDKPARCLPCHDHSATMASCCAGGDSLGWATPIDAYTNSERETLLYTIAVVPDHSRSVRCANGARFKKPESPPPPLPPPCRLPCFCPTPPCRPDYLATIDADPESETYSQVTVCNNSVVFDLYPSNLRPPLP
jgi:hypothetical protein